MIFARTPVAFVTTCILSITLASCMGKKKKPEAPKPDTTKAEPAKDAAKPAVAEMKEIAAPEVPKLPWSYEGEKGANFWGIIDPLYLACSKGKKQSPIDLRWRKPIKGRLLEFNYKEDSLHVTDNGHSVQVNFAPGSSVVIGGEAFELMHAQLRTSSEHTLSGNELPMELQFYHRNKQGKIAAISVIIIEGKSNEVLANVLNNLPAKMNETREPGIKFNPVELLPPTLTYYNYEGSLTYPPCTEGIDWNVLNTPITASREQILKYRKVYSSNKRPVQPLNGRKITNY